MSRAVSMSAYALRMSFGTGVDALNIASDWIGRNTAPLTGGSCPADAESA